MPLILKILTFLIIGIFLFYIAISIQPAIDQWKENFVRENLWSIIGFVFLLPWIAAAIYIIRVLFK